MALYRVQSNGKAPTGLQAGDEVVTGGGTYRILGVNADGSYRSALSNQQQTIYNYRGSYGVPAARAAQQPVQDLSGVSEAKAALGRVQAAKPGAYASRWEGQLQELYDRIAERGDFSYDLGKDPMYRQAREQYQTAGRLAMQDTMGQAAALTGGYGSSYSQAVGQEQYGAYLEKLGNVMPQLYSAAYSRYKSEGDALSEKYAMAVKRGESEYNRYRDRLSDAKAQQELGYKLEQQDYERQQKAFQTLMSLISSTGYEANEDDLKQSGMSQAQADAIRNEFLRKNGLLDTGGTSSGAWYGGYASKEQTKLDANEKKSSSGKNRRT